MIIVIDAYNLLRSVPPYKKTITDKERAHFIVSLGTYGHRKGHKMVIVFDGGAHEWAFKEQTKVVTIIYSGIHETADDYIKEYVQLHHAKDLLVVSSDTELNRYAQRYNIPSIDSVMFYQLVMQELSAKTEVTGKDSEVVKMGDESFIDELMMNASKQVPVKSEDFIALHKRHNTKKTHVSKHDRALLKKVHKL
jgi:predicted RNA-binding protein with PIN domain